jgi:hypothetical protein
MNRSNGSNDTHAYIGITVPTSAKTNLSIAFVVVVIRSLLTPAVVSS